MIGYAHLAAGRARRRRLGSAPLIALCALISSGCSAATAQTWQCRAPAGRFDEHDIAMPRSATALTGEMMIRKVHRLSRWYPTARVVFNDRSLDASGCHCNGVVATWYPDHPDSFQVALSVDGKEIPVARVPYDKPIRFALSFSWNGALKLQVGRAVATGQSSSPLRDNLHMSCSTADVDFTVAVAAPNPPSPERCPFAAREQWTAADIDRYCRVRTPRG